MFLTLQQESSGYPFWVYSDADQDRYIEGYRRAEEIALDKASICKNVGQRLAKIKVNTMWRKGLKPEQDPDNAWASVKNLYELLTNSVTKVTNLKFPNDSAIGILQIFQG
jgi:predicted RNA polymerase sigma factor